LGQAGHRPAALTSLKPNISVIVLEGSDSVPKVKEVMPISSSTKPKNPFPGFVRVFPPNKSRNLIGASLFIVTVRRAPVVVLAQKAAKAMIGALSKF
jgi:hypothetical protein